MTDEQRRREIADALTRELSDRGQIVEGGWKAYELLTGLKAASQVQRQECRKAFFFGAQHLFASVVAMLDPGREPTELDVERMNKLDREFQRFQQEFKRPWT